MNGTDGEDVPEMRNYQDLDLYKCADAVMVRNETEYTMEHKFCGTMAIQGTDGGDGGCGGTGGKSGEIRIFGLKPLTNIVPLQKAGMK